MSDLVDAAREYMNAGLSIIALSGKAPNGAIHRHGLMDAWYGNVEDEDDERMLREAFDRPGTTGIGIVIPKGCVVADIDSDEAAWRYMHMAGELPDTAIARTRNGLHVWFAAMLDGSRWIEKLLIRGPGSYVVAPPSVHPEGGVYTWVTPLVVRGMKRNLGFLPDSIADELRLYDAIDRTRKIVRPIRPGGLVDGKLYAGESIDGLVHFVEESQVGQRNSRLAWAVMTARDGGVDLETSMELLGNAAITNGLSSREVRTTIRSAYRRTRKATL